jgi:DNA mismatch repair protein MutH
MSILHNKTSLATRVYFDVERLHVCLSDGREIGVPLSWFPRLQQATDDLRQQWELIGNGIGIHWEAIDEDISVAGLLGLPND